MVAGHLFIIFAYMKRILFLLLLWLGLPAAAQVTTASISGRIFDENGPIEGVTVVAIHQPTNTQYYATTGRGGWYQLLDVLPGGPYTLRVHYFSYKPLTVRNLFTYAGQNVVVDADLEAGTSEIRIDEAATSLRLGASLGGGAVPVSPLGFDLVSQEIDTPVPFDVRQEAPLEGVSRLRMTPTGTNRFHGSAYAYYGATPSLFGMLPGLTSGAATGMTGVGGLTLSAPLASEDYQLFAGIQYDGVSGFNGSGRFDARLGSANRLDVSGGRLDGADAWASAGLTTSLRDGGLCCPRGRFGLEESGCGRYPAARPFLPDPGGHLWPDLGESVLYFLPEYPRQPLRLDGAAGASACGPLLGPCRLYAQ